VSYAHLVPPVVLFLAKNPLVDSAKLVSLQTLVSAAAPLGTGLTQEVENKLGLNVLQGMVCHTLLCSFFLRQHLLQSWHLRASLKQKYNFTHFS